MELELRQARYEASLAERRYAACDPDNRLIAAQLEKSWEAALRRVEACQRDWMRCRPRRRPRRPTSPGWPTISRRLERARRDHATRQRLLRALVTDIIADVDEAAREVVLTIHWRGGQHSQLRVRKPKSGEHGCRTPEEALAVMPEHGDAMVGRGHRRVVEPDGNADRSGKDLDRAPRQLAAQVHGIHAYRSAEKNGEWLTMSEAAREARSHPSRIPPAHQGRRPCRANRSSPGRPTRSGPPTCRRAGHRRDAGKGAPCRVDPGNQLPMFTGT